MSIRNLSLKTAALLLLTTMAFPLKAQPVQQASATTSHAASLPVVHGQAGVATTIVLTITTPDTISWGQDVGGFATVSSGDGSALTGTVTFYDGAANICTIPVTQTTSCPPGTGIGFAVGTHMLTATYSGDSAHLGAVSNTVPITVMADAMTLTLTSSANPSVYGQNVVFTAMAHAAYATPTGSITFLDGTTVLGKTALNASGGAVFSTSFTGAGSHNITATYAGDTRTGASSSAALTEVIDVPSTTDTGQGPFTLTVTGTPAVDAGAAVNLLVTVAPKAGSIQPIQLSCSGLPSESTCTFGAGTLPMNGGTTSLQITTMAPHDCGSPTPYFRSAGMPLAGPAIAGLLLLFLPRRRRKSLRGLLLVIVAVCGLASLTGCGDCTDLGTRPGDYTISVIGTGTITPANAVIAKIVLHVTVP